MYLLIIIFGILHAIIFLIIVGVLVASGFLIAFIWAVRSGQYEDNYGPAVRILFDDPPSDQADKDQTKDETKNHEDEPNVNSDKNNQN
ncbi:MAG: cbb3-type cytochrome oxidase assembly protein CcoS [Bacteroidota bacterium]|nr:cbb3-type cytochrome oxidase assembly protein CcoS [Bacteroidota bacterium]